MDFFNKATESLGGGGNGAEGELFQKAEGYLQGSQGGSAPTASSDQAPGAAPGGAPAAQQSASGGGGNSLYGSAQTLYQGLEDKISGKQSNIDDQQLAEAASNVLKAADNSSYIKDSQYAQYVDKAQSYLQKYGGGQSGTEAAAGAGVPQSAPQSGALAGRTAQPTDGQYADDSSYQSTNAPSADDSSYQ